LFFFILAEPDFKNCTEGEIRLVNGPDNFEGRVEVCHNNEWGTVCDNSWSASDGIVACRQLGLSYVSVTTNAYYGQGGGKIWLDKVSCTGSESQLTDCTHNEFSSNSCTHHEDAGLVCNSKEFTIHTPCYILANSFRMYLLQHNESLICCIA